MDSTPRAEGSSVGDFRWKNRVIPFIRLLARSNQWTIGLGDTEYQVSVTSFAGNEVDPASSAEVHWNFGDDETASKSDLVAAINSIREMGAFGTTRTEVGMEAIRTTVLGSAGDRSGCDNLCIVITDGGATNPTAFAAELENFQMACSSIIAVGITTSVPTSELDLLASRSDLLVRLSDFPELEGARGAVEEMICTSIEVCPQCLDVVVLADASSSVGQFRWETQVVRFLRDFATTREWNIGFEDEESYQFSLVTFGTEAELQWKWGADETSARAKLKNAFLDLVLPAFIARGLTNIGGAMKIAREQVLTDTANNRANCADICMIITDGAVNELDQPGGTNPIFARELPLFKPHCNKIIAVGISTSVDADELNSIATSADFVVKVKEDFGTVERILAFGDIQELICDEVPQVGGGDDMCCPYNFPQYARLY